MNKLSELVESRVPQPEGAEIYYSRCTVIDKDSRSRQDAFMLEQKLGPVPWSINNNGSILGMIVVYIPLHSKGCKGVPLNMN